MHRLAAPEIGWIEVETSDAERIPSGPWMAWHEDGLTPPPLAYELASNAAGTQAFCLRRHLAVQFHPEVTPDIVEVWATSPTSRLGETGQTVAGLRELSEDARGRARRSARSGCSTASPPAPASRRASRAEDGSPTHLSGAVTPMAAPHRVGEVRAVRPHA